jgi:hypothetical protein
LFIEVGHDIAGTQQRKRQTDRKLPLGKEPALDWRAAD